MIYNYPDTSILVFCKAPVAGSVKTRLMPEMTGQAAADVHIELTNRILSALAQSHLCPIQLWCSPDSEHPFFDDCVDKFGVFLEVQQGCDLGQRMLHAVDTALKHSSRVLLIGCDCPSLNIDDLDFAINALQRKDDIVISPAQDGGYVMIGMKQAYSELFVDMTWGHAEVFEVTQQKIKRSNLNSIETIMHWDVDTFEDFQRYQKEKFI